METTIVYRGNWVIEGMSLNFTRSSSQPNQPNVAAKQVLRLA